MNTPQLCIHVARHAAARLSNEIKEDLPLLVERALADADIGDVAAGFEPPHARDPGSLIARLALLGASAVRGQDEDGPVSELPERLIRQRIADAFGEGGGAQRPPGMAGEQYERTIAVVTDELVEAARRHDVRD